MRVPGLDARLLEQNRVPLQHQFQQPDLNFRYVENHFNPGIMLVVAANYAHGYGSVARYNRIECPVFDGVENFRSWKCRCEQFFEVQQVPEFLKVRTVYFSLVGDALEWHHSFLEDKRGMAMSWEMYTYNMGLRFDRNQLGSPMQQLKELVQSGGIEEYQREFEKLRAQTRCSEMQALDMFLGGMNQKLKKLVATSRPISVLDAYNLAKLHEDALLIDFQPNSIPYSPMYNQHPLRNTTYQQKYPTSNSSKPASNQHNLKPQPITNLNPNSKNKTFYNNDYEERRRKNLCFWCDEKYSPAHKCEKKKMFNLQVVTAEDEPENFHEVEEFPEEEEDEGNDQGITLCAVNGNLIYNTFKVAGQIKGKPVLILIDSGSTHNVVNATLVEKLKLETKTVPTYKVSLANGNEVKGNTQCSQLKWGVGSESFEIDALVLPLFDYDVILGMQWLEGFERMVWNFRERFLQFQHKGKEVILQIVPRPKASWMTSEQLLTAIKKDQPAEGNQYYFMMLSGIGREKKRSSVLTGEQQLEMDEVLSRFSGVFVEPKTLPPKRPQDHRIHLKSSEPISVKPYRYPAIQKDAMEEIVKELLASGVIRNNTSPFSSPVVLVKKKDDTWRMCIDYRELNKATVKDTFPMPVIEELLEEMHGAQYFSKIDLRSGYHQIRMWEDDICKTAFRTHSGHYEFLVMPFGLTNAPSTFQATMNELLKNWLRKMVLVFFDDILIYSKSWEEHLHHLEIIFGLLREHQFFAKRSKCEFGTQQIEYLGHIVSVDGVATDPEKIEAMVGWPVPKSVKELRGFLGLTGYYRRFVKSYGQIAKPLTKLLQKGSFQWSEEAQRSFEQLKQAMTETPVLKMPDFSKPFVVETDASGKGIGAVLMQDNHPIAFASKALAPKHLGMSVYEKELLALVLAVTKWRAYLLGRHFIIKTDHHSLKYLVEQKLVTPVQQKWLSKLLGFDYEIRYKRGSENVVADSLSRIEKEVS